MIVWLNGMLSDIDGARIDPRDRGFTLGDGVYETIRVKAGRLVSIERHFARLADGLRVLGIEPPHTEAALADAIAATLQANDLTDASLRLTVTRGPAARGLLPDPAGRPTIAISCARWSAPAAVRAMIATVTRRNEHSPVSRIKSINCLDAVLARLEAARLGFDEAILLNAAGHVAEATIANVFALVGADLVTPPIADGALPGVMRAEMIGRLGAVERSLSAEDLGRASEVFLTSSLGVRPVLALDQQPLAIGPATAQALLVAA